MVEVDTRILVWKRRRFVVRPQWCRWLTDFVSARITWMAIGNGEFRGDSLNRGMGVLKLNLLNRYWEYVLELNTENWEIQVLFKEQYIILQLYRCEVIKVNSVLIYFKKEKKSACGNLVIIVNISKLLHLTWKDFIHALYVTYFI